MRARFAVVAAGVAALICLAGCATSLPSVRGDYIQSRAQTMPADAAPVLSWHGEAAEVHTYWGVQRVQVQARAWFPSNATDDGAALWEVVAKNGEGKPLPFIGVERRYTDARGQAAAKLVPPLDMDRVPDGLYIIISPGIEFAAGKPAKIMPVANIVEIRRNAFKPFWFPLRLIPDAPSELTPAPPPPPEEPEGTPLPG